MSKARPLAELPAVVPVDPFDQVAQLMRGALTVKATSSDWIVRCPRCGAGWIVAKPRAAGDDLSPRVFPILDHVIRHAQPGLFHRGW
jgi:hypothetical protein